jgi:hypothetical protein
MVNANKQKGDRAEREAVEALVSMSSGLRLTPLQMRALGAGRKEDTGDIHVFPDVAIQVKNYAAARLNAGIREAAVGAVRQAANGLLSYHLGMTVIPRARKDGLRWVASAVTWVAPVEPETVVANPTAALELVKKSPFSLILVQRKGTEDILVSSLDRWMDDYRTVKSLGL